ncbi:hypothetical protein LSUE1_G008187 [Lachnellula suecica]|uniref:Ubiquitin-like domain-containing protein n=1 Tax=Lachnellula suecica TaxID=602035 RepID=A0A8T9BYB7_9HELO|nr:hypothetical protein LSUE1_G008187 [Lachnellula suecica]
MQAQSAAAEHDAKVVSEKLEALSALETVAKESLNRRLTQIQESIEGQNQVFTIHTVMLEKVSSDIEGVAAAVRPMAEVAFDMKNMLVQVQETLVPWQSIPQNLTPWLQNAIFLEDSLGYVLPVPLETISSWDTLHIVLCDKFKDRPGYDLVKRRRYLFQNGANARDLSFKIQLMAAVRPGQKVNMSMILFSPQRNANVCPGCGAITVARDDADVECSNTACQMIYRRVVDVTNVLALDNQTTHLENPDIPNEQNSSWQDYDFNDGAPTTFRLQGDKDNSPDVFKRVRLFTRWQDAADSRAQRSTFQFGDISLWECAGAAVAMYPQISYHTYKAMRAERAMHDDRHGTFAWNLFFLGTSRQNSRPTLLVYAKTKQDRQRAFYALKRLEWLGSEKAEIMVTTWYNPLIRQDIIEWFVRGGDNREVLEEMY